MKKLITSTALMTLIIFGFTSCQKKDAVQPTLTMAQKIQGIWILQNIVTNDHFAGADHKYTTAGTAADIFDFRADGKVYYTVNGSKDTVTYSIVGDTKLIIDGTENYDISTLTPSLFTVYQKDVIGADYFEETITWKK